EGGGTGVLHGSERQGDLVEPVGEIREARGSDESQKPPSERGASHASRVTRRLEAYPIIWIALQLPYLVDHESTASGDRRADQGGRQPTPVADPPAMPPGRMDQQTAGRSTRQGPFDHPPSSSDPGEGRFRRVDGGATRAFGCLREAVPIHGALVAAVVRSSRAGRALHPDRLPGGTGRGGPRVDRGSHPVLPAPEREGSRAVLAPLPGTGGGVQDRRRRPRGPRS